MSNLLQTVPWASTERFTSTVPQSHSSPASSRALPQRGTTEIVLTERSGLDKQLGWARAMNSASWSTLQSLKNSGNAWFPVLKRRKEISASQKTQWTSVRVKTVYTPYGQKYVDTWIHPCVIAALTASSGFRFSTWSWNLVASTRTTVMLGDEAFSGLCSQLILYGAGVFHMWS